jgi:pimeloyl-ACP methyl ester carboxylesterase
MLGFAALLATGAFSAYHVVSTNVSHPHPTLERVVYEVQVGTSPLNRFAITHVQKRSCHSEGSLILLSPFLLPGAFYEVSESGGYQNSAAGRLADSNVDVWLVDQRRTGLAPGACESGAADCSVMADWNFDTYSNDALFALGLVKSQNPGGKPAIGGFSAGANAALATLNRAPREFSGLFLYEGTFYTEDPLLRQHNDAICTDLESKLAAGIVFDPSAAVPGLVLQLVAGDPNAVSPLPFFPPGTTNQQAALFVFGAPPPPGAFAPTPGFVRCIADFPTQSFVYTNQDRLELVGPLFDSYASVAAMRDLACGLAGRDDSHFDHVGAFRGKALIFVEGTGFGQAMFDTASLLARANVTIDHNPELGEADPYFHQEWEQVFLKPLQRWLGRVF